MSLKLIWDNIHLRLQLINVKKQKRKLETELDKIHQSYDEEMIKLAKFYEKQDKTMYKRCEMLSEDNRRLASQLRKYEKGGNYVTERNSKRVAREKQNDK